MGRKVGPGDIVEANPGAEVTPGSHDQNQKIGTVAIPQGGHREAGTNPKKQVGEQQHQISGEWLDTDRPTNADTGPETGHKNQQTVRKGTSR